MRNIARRLFDADRLAAELAQKEAELDEAREEIEQLRMRLASAPRFEHVAESFDVSNLHSQIRQKVIDDLSSVLKREALDFLEQTMRRLDEGKIGPRMITEVAHDMGTRCHEFRFKASAMSVTVRGVTR